MWCHKGKGKRKCIAVNGIPSHSYGVSLAIWDLTVLPAIRHKWAHPALTPAIQAGTRFTYPGGMEGWGDLGEGWVSMVQPWYNISVFCYFLGSYLRSYLLIYSVINIYCVVLQSDVIFFRFPFFLLKFGFRFSVSLLSGSPTEEHQNCF